MTVFDLVIMFLLKAFLANETPVIRAVAFGQYIRMIFTINLQRFILSNQILNLLVKNEH